MATVTTPGLDPLTVLLQRKSGRWTVSNYGTSDLGCGVNRAVQVNLDLDCYRK